MANLTPKQQRFVEEYLIDLNATQAAIRSGYSEKSAQEIGAENLSKPMVAKAIQEALQERKERVQIDADYVLKRLVEIDQMDVLDVHGDIRHLEIVEAKRNLESLVQGDIRHLEKLQVS